MVREDDNLSESPGLKKAMQRHWTETGSGWTAICTALLLGACSTTPVQPRPVRHVVLIWQKHPARQTDRAQLIRAAHSLRMMPGVLKVETGRAVPLENSEIDRSFDLGVVITFRDRAALERYEKDPWHADAMQRYLRPLVRRYVIYNLGDR